MTFKSERQAVTDKFMEAWNADDTPVKMDNVNGLMKNGDSKIKSDSGLDEFCHLRILPNSANRADINAIKRIRYTGNIVVNVFVKAGSGTDRARELADKVAVIFGDTGFDNIVTRSASFTNQGQTPDSSFYQITVMIPYYRDESF